MKPDFALTLSFDGISLLHRVSGGWMRVGDVALDASDLRSALADLRAEADSLSNDGGLVKLVLPNEQVKYLSIADPGGSESDVLEEVQRALDGATPYAVDELSFDWVRSDGQVKIAAVANETLDEAEAFAKSHHFVPVSYVANAADDQFVGEVFFGTAASWSGEPATKEDEALVIVEAPREPIDAEGTVDVNASMADLVEDTGSVFEETALSDDTSFEEDIRAEALRPGIADDPEPANTQTPAPSFASVRASRNLPPAPAAPATVASPPAVATDAPAPRFKLGGARKSTKDTDVTAASLQVEPAEEPSERKRLGFFSRRQPAKPKDEPTLTAPVVPAPSPQKAATPPIARASHDPAPAREAVARIAAMRAGRQPKGEASSDAAALPDERQRMTVFGARTEPQIGGKPRYLGLMLTSALLVFLLAVAAWASVFLDEGVSRFFDRDNETPSIARLPDVELLPLDGSITAPPAEDETVQLASLDLGQELQTPDTGLTPVLPPPASLTPEEADARYAATGIWQRSPEAPKTPELTSLDGLYVASIDGQVEQLDAVALPEIALLRIDDAFATQTNPPVPGSKYQLNDRGLVVATPEGAVNPEGVRIFAGLPPVVPPARPSAPEAAPDPEVAPAVETTDLQTFRPRPRPNGLVEGNERLLFGGWTKAELAAFRPNPRPATIKEQEEEAQPEATEFAVERSMEPVTRPRDFGRIVARAKELRENQSTQQVTQVAAIAPRTVQPSIPSTANVARQATVKNAINLRRINLIGVYGKPSSRRALVRLANGRYQKVEVGDRLDGGRVSAIGTSELRYTKNGRNVVLDMPDG